MNALAALRVREPGAVADDQNARCDQRPRADAGGVVGVAAPFDGAPGLSAPFASSIATNRRTWMAKSRESRRPMPTLR